MLTNILKSVQDVNNFKLNPIKNHIYVGILICDFDNKSFASLGKRFVLKFNIDTNKFHKYTNISDSR